MEDLQRINVKFYLQDPNSLSGSAAFRIFNTWITENSEEVLVDVADYNHVGHGPITLLIGHEANYSLDSDEGELGLLYARKQPQEGDLSSRLVGILTAALSACRRLETAPELEHSVSFLGTRLKITANDRLYAPNTEEGESALRATLDPILDRLFAGGQYAVERDETDGERLNLHVRSKGDFTPEMLLTNLAA